MAAAASPSGKQTSPSSPAKAESVPSDKPAWYNVHSKIARPAFEDCVGVQVEINSTLPDAEEGDAFRTTPLKREAPRRGETVGRLKPTKVTSQTNTFHFVLAKPSVVDKLARLERADYSSGRGRG